MNIIIGADVVPTKSNYVFFENGDVENLIGNELKEIIYHADYRIYNLEVPLVDELTPSCKCGENLYAPTKMIKGISALKPDLITLANNHILDQGINGLNSTIDILHKVGIDFVGVGNDLSEATKGYTIDKDGIKIGIYACVEHEFSLATEAHAGANPFDVLYSFEHIENLKRESDYVIVLYHGMKELYRYPTPKLQKILRYMIKKGADLVICQHSHCIGCEENYLDGKIIYGQGNFIFDYGDNEYWNSSLLINVNFEKNMWNVGYVPIIKTGNVIRIANNIDREEILSEYKKRSQHAQEKEFINQQYELFAQNSMEMYLRNLSGRFGKNIMFKILNKLFGRKLIYYFYSQKDLLSILNIIECEAHNELLLKGLSDRISYYK